MSHQLPELGYAYDSLEPHIDARTMEIHHTKHHNAYVAGLNAALDGNEELQGLSVEELIKNLDKVPADILTPVRNHGGGHFNHSFFWKVIAPGGATAPSGDLAAAIDRASMAIPDADLREGTRGRRRATIHGRQGLAVAPTGKPTT